jgi:hypothetical protein
MIRGPSRALRLGATVPWPEPDAVDCRLAVD